MFSPRCPACNRPLGDEVVHTAHATFHPECWDAVRPRVDSDRPPPEPGPGPSPEPPPFRPMDADWRPVPGFLGYEVTRTGACRSWSALGSRPRSHRWATTPRVLAPNGRDRHGRPYGYQLSRQGQVCFVTARNLVRLAFPEESDG